jgi:hypothetical protein
VLIINAIAQREERSLAYRSGGLLMIGEVPGGFVVFGVLGDESEGFDLGDRILEFP